MKILRKPKKVSRRFFLKETKCRFIEPNIFKGNLLGSSEVFFGYLLKEGIKRFKVDAVEPGLEIDSSLCSEQQIDSFKRLKRIILNSEKFYISI